jgi:diguanylate cyclase (GGDEF)-like protein/PAS domain S-box-containing protein
MREQNSSINQYNLTQQYRPFRQAMAWGFIKIILPLVLISALAIVVFQVQSYKHEISDLRAFGEISVRASSEVIYSDFRGATADLRTLAASTAVQKMVESGGKRAIEDVAKDFLVFAANKDKYDQVRYIDSQGIEVVRVNYNGGKPVIVPEDQLQSKADRYYFRDTMSLARDEIFVSPLDLNIENGQIERPHKPMIRFGIPLYDSANTKRGVLILNYLGDHFLNHINGALSSRENETMLLNAEGFWLLAPEQKDEWGFMFKNGRRFQDRFPAAWQTFQQQNNGVYQDDRGIFVYASVRPMLEGQVSSSGSAEAYAPSSGSSGIHDYVWTLVSHTPEQILKQKQKRHWQIGLLQYVLLLLVIIPLTLAFAWAQVRKRAADTQVEQLEQRMHDIAQSLAVGLFVLDQDGRLSMMNPEAERLLGWTEDELRDKKVHDLICSGRTSDATDAGTTVKLHDCFSHKKLYRSDDLFQRKDGSSFYAAYVASPLMVDGQPAGAVISFQDISARKQMEQELERMATLDELTGLYNRRELNRRMEDELRRAERYDHSFSVWMLDIDHFKQINDNYGHQEGDRVLKMVANSLKRILRDTDIVARFGGEEFVIVLPHTNLKLSQHMAERVRAEMAAMQVELDGASSFSITVSIGVAAFPQHGSTVESLINTADKRLYIAKEGGRNRVSVV